MPLSLRRSAPTAAETIASSLASPRDSIAAIRPSRTTATRSQRWTSSGVSELDSTTAFPASASLRSMM